MLLVEDNFENRTIYAAYLNHRGYRVLEAATGLQGLDLARRLRPDVILLDISLPIIDGWSLAERLQRDAGTAAIPILILSAYDAGTHDSRGISYAGYLVKPCDPPRVVAEVEACIGPPLDEPG